MVDTESINPGVSRYLEKIESRLNRKARLAHEIGAGAKCLKCKEKCPGFELHYWRYAFKIVDSNSSFCL